MIQISVIWIQQNILHGKNISSLWYFGIKTLNVFHDEEQAISISDSVKETGLRSKANKRIYLITQNSVNTTNKLTTNIFIVYSYMLRFTWVIFRLELYLFAMSLCSFWDPRLLHVCLHRRYLLYYNWRL